MMKRAVAGTPIPAVGPYSQAVRAGGLVFCSGQIPIDPETGELRAASVAEATERCLLNLRAVLGAAGCSLEDVAQITVYMTDLGKFAEMNEAYARFFPSDPPARAAVQVSALPKGAPVEIVAVAVDRASG